MQVALILLWSLRNAMMPCLLPDFDSPLIVPGGISLPHHGSHSACSWVEPAPAAVETVLLQTVNDTRCALEILEASHITNALESEMR